MLKTILRMTEHSLANKKAMSKIEIPNRGKGKYNSDVGMEDFYRYYKNNFVPKRGSSYDIDGSTYRSIISDFNMKIIEKIVKESFDFHIPCRLGILGVRKYKKKPFKYGDKYVKNLPIDWKSTKELWEKNEEARKNKKLVRYLNKDKGGYIYKIFYFKGTANYKNKSAYKFKSSYKFKEIFKKELEKGEVDYYLYEY